MQKPFQITNLREFSTHVLKVTKAGKGNRPDGRIQFALYHIVRPKVPDFPWVFAGDIEQWNMPLHDYLAEFMAEVGSESLSRSFIYIAIPQSNTRTIFLMLMTL